MIPKGFLEDPFVYPSMSCPVCAFRFQFQEPFDMYDSFLCPKCEKEVEIPDAIIDQFVDNIEFMQYIKERKSGGGNSTTSNTPPPIFQ